ncbi:MAG: hypothetical protein PHH67_03775 [Methanosarcina sp.]|nr:hypothetical protein [Methanosarcina sp.]MDD3317691.1 hypothetical protein [Methanosarcina sp.]MDD4305623.1 hypothetical protein [Methanosarcina sp.]NLN43312.1 hypothetical protein [Methanosarcina sp.]
MIKNANLSKKGLIENSVTVGFESLILKPYRRDQPAQRLRCNGCGSAVLHKVVLDSVYWSQKKQMKF